MSETTHYQLGITVIDSSNQHGRDTFIKVLIADVTNTFAGQIIDVAARIKVGPYLANRLINAGVQNLRIGTIVKSLTLWNMTDVGTGSDMSSLDGTVTYNGDGVHQILENANIYYGFYHTLTDHLKAAGFRLMFLENQLDD
jgi:hypothetical protein